MCLSGVCKVYPNTTGADCDPDVGCDGRYLYCSSETKKCTEYPKRWGTVLCG